MLRSVVRSPQNVNVEACLHYRSRGRFDGLRTITGALGRRWIQRSSAVGAKVCQGIVELVR